MLVTPIRLVAVDLDGTLLAPDGTVPTASLEALGDLQAHGIAWCVATGRPEAHLRTLRTILTPTAGWIWSYGAHATDRWWERHATIEAHTIETVIDLLDHDFPDAALAVECGRTMCREERYPPPVWNGARNTTIVQRSLMPLLSPDMVCIQSAHLGKIVIALEEMDVPLRGWETGTDGYMEFTASAATKRTALASLAAHLGVRAGETAAIGDGHSDTEMLRWAALGITVEHAHPGARDAADHVLNEADWVRIGLRMITAHGQDDDLY